jgi:diaminohydroxyphosphoribosylaminopyrimidine deaminase/5-amino-6-(5-phosphoribosylamino)uracil reductase
MADFSIEDHTWMARALRVAEGGRHLTTPNPSVGCVLVRDGRLIGEGHTQVVGGPHAEVMAMRDAAARGEPLTDATAYVTLEPCAHHGRTPPCADALLAAGIGRVVAAMVDPHPKVAGQGLARLRAGGVQVAVGLMADAARESLQGFLSRIERGRPWLRLKLAASLDGKTALANGESKWITGAAARADVQRWRARSCAMITGIGTVLADDPLLTVRELDGQPWTLSRQPLRVVLDTTLRLPATAPLLTAPGRTVVVTLPDADPVRRSTLEATGAEVLALPADAQGRIELHALLHALGERGINEATVEAGATLAGAFLAAGLVDELVLYQAPKLLGDAGRGLAAFSLNRLADAQGWQVIDQRAVGADLRWILRPTRF